ncbi:RICIN domain-containing protein [Singulisphaera rosea]
MIRFTLSALLLAVSFETAANAQSDWEGDFTITSQWNNLAVDVPNGRKTDGLAIIQWACHGKDAQRWRVEPVDAGRGWYKIVNAFTGMALDIKDESKDDRAIVIQSECKDTKTQHWRIDRQPDGSYKITSRYSGKCLDIPYGSKDPGTELELCEDNNQANQRWVFAKAKSMSSPCTPGGGFDTRRIE